MSADKHLTQAIEETARLARELDELAAAILLGRAATADDLAHLTRIVTFVRAKTALALHDVARHALDDRRHAPTLTRAA